MVSGSAPFCPTTTARLERITHYTARASGMIIDTPSSFASSPSSSSTPDHRQTLIRACVDAFRSKLSLYPRNTFSKMSYLLIWFATVNVILVVGHEKLNVEMQRTYGNRMTVVKIPKSGGVCISSFCSVLSSLKC
jgi:polyribonucleotide 5'-hydroxyl-kinase